MPRIPAQLLSVDPITLMVQLPVVFVQYPLAARILFLELAQLPADYDQLLLVPAQTGTMEHKAQIMTRLPLEPCQREQVLLVLQLVGGQMVPVIIPLHWERVMPLV